MSKDDLKVGIKNIASEIDTHKLYEERALDKGDTIQADNLRKKINWKTALKNSAEIILYVMENGDRVISDKQGG